MARLFALQLLMLFCILPAMEAPSMHVSAIASLKQLAAKTIVASYGFPLRYPTLATLVDDYKDSINYELLNSLESRFFSEDKRGEKILFGGRGSRCAFLHDEKYVACYKQRPLEINILNLEALYSRKNDALSFTQDTNDYRRPFFIKSSQVPSKYQGIFYTLDRKGFNTYKIIKDSSHPFAIKPTRILFKDPLPGKVHRITQCPAFFLVQTSGGRAKDQEYLFAIDLKGRIEIITRHSNKIPITKIIPGPSQTSIIIFSNGNKKIFNPRAKIITPAVLPPEHPFKIPKLYNSSVAVSPDQNCMYVGFSDGKLQEYNATTQTVRTYYLPEDDNAFGPIVFLDSNLFVTTRHFPRKNTNKEAGWLELWHATHLQPIAYYQLDDPYCCNSIQVDAQKKNILLGMGMFDVTAVTLDSFTFNPEVINTDQVYRQPEKLFELVQKQPISFQDKIEFLLNYIKK